ncbi:LpxL/LpxP family acyltransferase [Methylotuvimicrobium alcaliphilum]|uniref:Lipid A biosynthesis acyltransferase n=1 Tax=Methylotuvimicrobium alcaliphilum (strain DSM 19304 / NCIMB 14124 / VKM B-2133 / 20Z) TaxID=1091494 RepID=G4SWR2_META2|nr:lipid A biosynthesis acyltransferase [Methylotuvimicrobium alcaliphilum]CCE25287.1 Lipid A biosynthesis acyltransferase [Methylotuvimicrobium alcaliphilum 20Z]
MKHWANMEERGVIWGMQLLLKVYLLFGRRVLQVFLYPVVSYYWLLNGKARAASIDYLKRVSAFLPADTIRSGRYGGYLHFIAFANAIIDKLAAWSGAISLNDVDYHGRDAIVSHLEHGQGVLILGSHLGNMEVCRVIAKLRKNLTVNVLVHTKHAEKFNALLNRYAESGRMNLIQVTEMNAATAMLLQDKIEAGELVVIAADRIPVTGQGRVVKARFLGATAMFPQGPYILASLLKCPVYTLFCLKRQGKQAIYFDHFGDGLNLPRKQRDERARRYAQDYADRLQYYCLQEPLQWFNFYDFWQDGND